MPDSLDNLLPERRRALLVFADTPDADCRRRGWPAGFRILLETHNFGFDRKESFDSHLFTSYGLRRRVPPSVQVHFQEGASFGQRLENAVETLANLGYEEIVIVGQDCPDLEPKDIRRAFDSLGRYRLVLGPDHRGGCYLIGLHVADRQRLRGVVWQRNTDFRDLSLRFANEGILKLAVKIDLDNVEDVSLLAASKSPFRWIARALLRSDSEDFTVEDDQVKARSAEERIHWQLPPPARRSC